MATMFIGVRRENKLKLIKIMASQKISIARKGMGIEVSACSKRSRRVCATSVASCIARSLNERCASVFGERMNFYISILRQGGRPERRSLRELRFVLSPNPPDQGINGPPQKIADIACLGAVLFEEVVEQYDVGGQMPNLGALGII
jgi:hypothetical protein